MRELWTNLAACVVFPLPLPGAGISQELGPQFIGYLRCARQCGSIWHNSGIKPHGRTCKVSHDAGQFWVISSFNLFTHNLKATGLGSLEQNWHYLQELFLWKPRRKMPVWLLSLVLLPCRELPFHLLSSFVCPGLLTASARKQHASSWTRGADVWENPGLGLEEQGNDGTI